MIFAFFSEIMKANFIRCLHKKQYSAMRCTKKALAVRQPGLKTSNC